MPPARRHRNRQRVVPVPRRQNPPRAAAQADPDPDPQDPIPAPREIQAPALPERPVPLLTDQQLETLTSQISTRVMSDLLPIYDARQGTTNFHESLFVDENLPSENCQIALPSQDLGHNVPNKIKLKIANGEYVDLVSLVSKPVDPEQASKQLLIEDGKLIVGPKASDGKIENIQQWTDAFLIYSTIYVTAHPSAATGLFKYMHTVRLGASRSVGSNYGWKNYDTQFRLKKESNPTMSWSVVDQELWLLYMGYANDNSKASSSANLQQRQRTELKCYDFNYKGNCSKNSCYYNHLCLRCSKPHPLIRCRNSAFRFGSQQSSTNSSSNRQFGNSNAEQNVNKPRRSQHR